MPLLRSRRDRTRFPRAFQFTEESLNRVSALEDRILAVPLFTRVPGTFLFGAAGANPAMQGVLSVFDANSTSAMINTPNQIAAFDQSSTATAIAKTDSGPDGGAAIGLSAELTGLITGTTTLGGSGPIIGTGATAYTGTTPTTMAPITWTVADSAGGTGTGFVTATFQLHATSSFSMPQGSTILFLQTLAFASNQITVTLNTPGTVGLNVFDNTTPGGPTLVYSDPGAGAYRGNPDFAPSDAFNFATTYQVRVPVVTPFAEAVGHTTTSGVAIQNANNGATSIQTDLQWTFTVSND